MLAPVQRCPAQALLANDPFDVGLDGFALVVDPAVGPGFFDHGGKTLLPGGVVLNTRPAAQGVLKYPGRAGIGEFGFAGECVADSVELRLISFNDKFEST